MTVLEKIQELRERCGALEDIDIAIWAQTNKICPIDIGEELELPECFNPEVERLKIIASQICNMECSEMNCLEAFLEAEYGEEEETLENPNIAIIGIDLANGPDRTSYSSKKIKEVEEKINSSLEILNNAYLCYEKALLGAAAEMHPVKRVGYLAMHSKKRRVRKKNVKRLLEWMAEQDET